MTDYEFLDFNDPSVCKGLNTNPENRYTIAEFLAHLELALKWGIAIPRQECATALSEIVNPELASRRRSDIRETQDQKYVRLEPLIQQDAQRLLATYFRPTEDEGKGMLPPTIRQDEKLLLPELSDHLSPDLMRLMGDYYSNCAVTTMDGKQCGKGINGGFDFLLSSNELNGSSPSSQKINCTHECFGDLCPQWLGDILNHRPSVVRVVNIETNETLTVPITQMDIGIHTSDASSDTSWDYSASFTTGVTPAAGEIAKLCRALALTTYESDAEFYLRLYLKAKLPSSLMGKVTFVFPEFKSGDYFIGEAGGLHWQIINGSDEDTGNYFGNYNEDGFEDNSELLVSMIIPQRSLKK